MRNFDYSNATWFLESFYAGTEHNVELRALSNDGSGRPGIMFTRDPTLVIDFCTRWDCPGYGTYFAVATRRKDASNGKRESLAELPGVWVEIDGYKYGLTTEQCVAALQQCPLRPTIIIFSGRGVHAYWLFREPLDVRLPLGGPDLIKEEVEAVLRQLCGVFAGDPNAIDITRVMRLVGTHNTREGDMRPVAVLDASGDRHELSDLVEMLDWLRPMLRAPAAAEKASIAVEADPFLDFASKYGIKPPIDVQQRLSVMTYAAADETAIHPTRLSVSSSLVAQGVEDEQIFELLLEATRRAAGTVGLNWNWKREEKIIWKEIETAKAKYAPTVPRPPGAARQSAPVIQLRPRQQPDETPAPISATPAGYVHNDIGNAMHLLALHRAALCYVVGIGWHIWDEKRYRIDADMIAAHRLAHNVSATQLESALRITEKDARKAEIKWAVSTGTNSRITAMLHQARSYAAHESDDLDADAWLLNCQNGSLDLRTMTLRPHNPADLCTKICGTVYDAQATCPRWESFLAEIFDGDVEMVRFVQCALGYSLTGSNKENVFFILHGTGKNGKSRLLETVDRVLGDYMISTPADTWAAKPAGAASNDIASLPGSRLVTANETEKNHSLREGLVKQITGGDKVSARKMFREFFEFTPQCKLWIATNNKPKVSGSDGAIWDRVRLLPFNVKFVPAAELVEGQKVRDNDLMEKLLAELPGILAWMVRGCAEWQRNGLKPAVAMMEAAGLYRQGQDSVQGFIDECCDRSHGLTCAVKDLFSAYEIWCGENDEEGLAKKAFGLNLEERGYPAGKTGSTRLRKRLDLKGEWRERVRHAGE